MSWFLHLLLGFTIVLFTQGVLAVENSEVDGTLWPAGDQHRCLSAEYTDFGRLGTKSPKKKVMIKAEGVLRKIEELLHKIPSTGEMMVKPAPSADHSVLKLHCADGSHTFEFILGRIKTKDTSFFRTEPEASVELLKLLKAQ